MSLTDLEPEEAAKTLLEQAPDDRWALRVATEIERGASVHALEVVGQRWDLSKAAMARLFGVSRQAFSKWLTDKPAADRADDIAALITATEIMERHLRPERIAAVVRRPAEYLGGRSLLDVAKTDGPRAVLDVVRPMFDLRRVQP